MTPSKPAKFRIPRHLRDLLPPQPPPLPPETVNPLLDVLHQTERIRVVKDGSYASPSRIEFSDRLPPLALKLLEHFTQRRPCRKLSQQDAFNGYPSRQIGKVVQALHRIGLLHKDGQTSGSQFLITPAGRRLLNHYHKPSPEPVPPAHQSPADRLPLLVLRLLEHFLELRPCRHLTRQPTFSDYKPREVSKALQALNTLGLVACWGQTSGSKFITTPAGRLLLEQYHPHSGSHHAPP